MQVARYSSRLITLAIVLVFGFAAWQLYQQSVSLSTAPAPVSTSGPTKLPGQLTILPADPVRGSSAAVVTLIEFSDFQCPYCAQVAPILASVVAQSGGRVRLVWKDFPLPVHAEALPAAEAAQCAAQQGKFWEYHDQLFQNQDKLGAAFYQVLGTQLGLAAEPFQRCLTQHELKPFIERNVAEGSAIGIDATPSLVIGNQVHRGVFTAEELAQFIK